jgi:hypothetical protein
MRLYLTKTRKKKNAQLEPEFVLVKMTVPPVITITRNNHPAGNAATPLTEQNQQIGHAAVLLIEPQAGLRKATNKRTGVHLPSR